MKTFSTQDGDTFKAGSALELVEHMRNSSRFASHENIEAFMRGLAQRFYEWDKSTIRCDTPENFVDDLLGKGFLTES